MLMRMFHTHLPSLFLSRSALFPSHLLPSPVSSPFLSLPFSAPSFLLPIPPLPSVMYLR